MLRRLLLLTSALIAISSLAMHARQTADVAPTFSFAEPGISPDGREIAFTSGGNIWTVPASGGDARLLIADGGTDRRPLYSPDGRSLAFVSTRTGGGDIYVMTLATGDTRRLTADDGPEVLDNWSRDGRWIYFSTTAHDIAGMNDIYRVSIDGGTPMPVSQDRYTNEFQAAPSPDGKTLAFAARGIASNQWWRKGSSHIDQSELWSVDLATRQYELRLAMSDARNDWPMWSGDGRSLFFISDRGTGENVWSSSESGSARAITDFRDGRVLWPSITLDGKIIAFERNFGIWTVDTSSRQVHEVPIVRRGAVGGAAPQRARLTSGFEDLALSPDGKKVAFIARGDVFAASAKDGGDAMRVTQTAEIESQPVWSSDSKRLVYVSARRGGQQLYQFDFTTQKETALTNEAGALDLSPVFSPDGKKLAYLRNRIELRVRDMATGEDSPRAHAPFADTNDSPQPVWSPNGKWIALFAIGTKAFTNVALVSVDTPGPLRAVSFLANVFTNTIAWSPDGTFLLFDTRQRTEPGQIARVDLTPRTPRFREDLFRDLFKAPETPRPPDAARVADPPKPAANVEPVFAGIRERLSLIPTGLDNGPTIISPDGKTMVTLAAVAGVPNLYSYSLDELSPDRPVARQLTTTPGPKDRAQFSPDGKDVYFLDNGRINVVSLDRREVRPIGVTAEMTIDIATEKMTVFNQAWTLLNENFFDPAFHGVNWAQSRATYGARVAGAATMDEVRRVISLMIGDLNASHLGITPPSAPPSIVGRLGATFDPVEYETNGRLKIASLIPLGPAGLTRDLAVGDVIDAIDGRPVVERTATGQVRANLDELLANTIDHRVELTVSRAGAAPRQVVVRPISQATEKALMYRAWVDRNREYVLKASGGRFGYVHMINMGAPALDQLFIDLDVENHQRDGVVIDIRNNTGGFVNAYALDVFSRQSYLRMSTRGMPESPARAVLGQRALELPTVLVTNQHSLSDAEDFSEGYRTLKLGPVVGEPTAGWIIYTWEQPLIDGSILRLPRMRVKAADLSDMELHPRPVDSVVSRPIGETLGEKDSQLDEAIRALLKRLGKAE